MYVSFMGIWVDPGQESLVEKDLAEMGEIVELYEASGPFELFAKARADSRKSMEGVVRGIVSLEGVEKTYSMLIVAEKTVQGEVEGLVVFLGIRADLSRERDICRALMDTPGVLALYTMLYPFDILIKINVESEAGAQKIRDRIGQYEGVLPGQDDFFLLARRVKPGHQRPE